MENSLVLSAVKSSLPTFSSAGVTYNDIAKMFLTPAWVSDSGNSYQEGLRASDKIVVVADIGHGYAHTFLNGIRIYRGENGKAVLIGERYFSNYWWWDNAVLEETEELLVDYLESQCKILGIGMPDKEQVRQLASKFANETISGTKLLAM